MKVKGFTLIELLVVIAIIGILSAVVLTSLTSSRDRANDANGVSTLGQLQLAMTQAQTNAGDYPAANTTDVYSSVTIGTASGTYQISTSTNTVNGLYCVSYALQSPSTAGGSYYVVDQNGARYASAGCS